MPISRLIGVLLFCLVGCASAPDRVADEKAISDVLFTQQAAWNRGDLDGFMGGYEKSEKLLFTSAGKVRRGWNATLEKYKRSYADKGAMGKLSFELRDIRFVDTDTAVILGHWALTETPKTGGGLFSLVMMRMEGGWKVVHDHTSLEKKP
jgi:uncharacterized protein (TIGR02246 family)